MNKEQWESAYLFNPAALNEKGKPIDSTCCVHTWNDAPGSFMVAGMIDFKCDNCHAHGWRRKGEGSAEIEYCCGGIQQHGKQ